MKLSVIILNYNVRHFLELCLKSVEAALVNIDSEIIVVDNQSSDDSCSMVKTLFPEVILISNSENYGFSKGNNIGVAMAKGEYVCILNPDTVIAEDTFEDALKFIEDKSEIGILGIRLIDGQGQFLPESKRYIPTPSVAIKKMLGFTDAYYVKTLGHISFGRVPVLVGAFMLMKKKTYNEVNGFDEDYFMYGDDIDLSYKVEKAGYHNMYFGRTSILHFKGESTLKDKIYAKRFYGAMQIFYNKHFKSNILFNTLVWLGVLLATWFQRPSKYSKNNPKHIVFVSNQSNEVFKEMFGERFSMVKTFNIYTDDTEYILDNNYLSFKSIIEILSNTPKNCTATFKILPKNSNFIIGSNSSKSRGAVVQLDSN